MANPTFAVCCSQQTFGHTSKAGSPVVNGYIYTRPACLFVRSASCLATKPAGLRHGHQHQSHPDADEELRQDDQSCRVLPEDQSLHGEGRGYVVVAKGS